MADTEGETFTALDEAVRGIGRSAMIPLSLRSCPAVRDHRAASIGCQLSGLSEKSSWVV
jgi:hypothetical protein